MNILSTYASGYPRYYVKDKSHNCPRRNLGGCDENEIRALEHYPGGTGDPENPDQWWWPRSEDFKTEAAIHSNRPVAVADMGQLINAIRRCLNLSKVLWFGHGIPGELQFGSGKRLTFGNIAMLPDLSAHFAPGGAIVFYSCDSGQTPQFFQAIANKLRVIVGGFDRGLKWEFNFDGQMPHRFITRRLGLMRTGGKIPEPHMFYPK